MFEDKTVFYMKKAIEMAKKSQILDEVPVGCIIVYNNIIVGKGFNRMEHDKDVTAHAEIIAIRQACRVLNCTVLPNCVMYVTLEPCMMCAGAILHSQIKKVIFAAMNTREGAFGSYINILKKHRNQKLSVFYGVLEKETELLIKKFFLQKRLAQKQIK